jgi:hypothetical protein
MYSDSWTRGIVLRWGTTMPPGSQTLRRSQLTGSGWQTTFEPRPRPSPAGFGAASIACPCWEDSGARIDQILFSALGGLETHSPEFSSVVERDGGTIALLERPAACPPPNEATRLLRARAPVRGSLPALPAARIEPG